METQQQVSDEIEQVPGMEFFSQNDLVALV